jgi:prepilin-type N-terminal cleavage/methylation domain-containing protein
MLCKWAKQQKGFTLIEMLVVVVIIAIMAGMALPSMSSFMRQRKLKGAGGMIMGMCTETRARAIAQRERQYLVFLVNNTSYNPSPATGPNSIRGPLSGANTIYSFDSDATDDPAKHQLISMERMPEFTQFDNPPITDNFYLNFYPDGTISFNGGITDLNVEVDDDGSANTDIVISQQKIDLKCYIDIIANTGRSRYRVH